jgi:hypothetical protein
VILRRIRATAAICAALPLLVLALFTARSPSQAVSQDTVEEMLGQVALPVEAQASAVRQQLRSVENQVLMLQAYATEVLKAPDVYAGPQSRTNFITVGAKPASPAPAPATGQPSTGGAPERPPASPVTLPPPGLDNPMVYSKGADGAIRKLIDDGGPAVFFRARSIGQFALNDKQRLLGSAALDPLLRQISKGPLAGQAYLLTADSLLRTAPFRDLSALPATRDLTATPLFAWKKEKAGESGVVWTTPYPSPLSGKWVIAALAGVTIGTRMVAVVGAEVPAQALQDNVLNFPIGTGSVSWIQRADGVLLAAPSAAEAALGVKPLAAGDLPTDDKSGKKVLEESNLYFKGSAMLAGPLAKMQASSEAEVEGIRVAEENRYVVTAPIAGTDLKLGALLQSPLIDRLLDRKHEGRGALSRTLTGLLISLAVGALLVLILSLLAARRIAVPLSLLTAKTREAVASGRTMPVALAEDSEVGALSRAVQDALDKL